MFPTRMSGRGLTKVKRGARLLLILALGTASSLVWAQPRAFRAQRPPRVVRGVQAVAAPANANAQANPMPEPLIPVAAEGTTDAALVEQVRQRLTKETAALNRQRAVEGKDPLPEPKAGAPRAMIDMAFYGVHHNQKGPQRFLALHLVVENSSAEPLTIPGTEIIAKLDGEAKLLVDPPEGISYSFQYGNQFQNLQNHKQLQQLKVPANGVAGGWLVYAGLPMASDVPPVTVQLKQGAQPLEIDVTESQRALLNLNVEALGPRDCLRLVTIQGMLNTVNVQSLVDALEQLTERKVVRFVVRWSNEAIVPDQNITNWLVQSTMQLGTGRPVNDQMPSLPAQLKEFHLVQMSGNGFPNFDQYGRPNPGLRLHKTTADAVGAAMKTAVAALPLGELVEEIQDGHAMTRAAALRHGAGRLNASHLPFLMECTKDEDAEIRAAAVRALSHFGEPAALEALVALARKGGDPLGGIAIESLAGSRYAAAQTQLLALLREENPELKKQIMQVLARYPRPQWSETIYAYVTDPKEKLPADGVRALLKVGHPKLVDVLETCLKSEDKALRDLAFPILAQRSDGRSERLATEYALAELAQRPPDGSVTQFLQRTKLTPAIPLVLKHLDAAQDKAALINLLAQIGDDAAGDEIARRYPQLAKNHEKSAALAALSLLHHPKFRPLAGEALLSTDSSMIQQATQGLMQDGGAEACQLLIAALEKQTNNLALHHICNALGNTGSPEARKALLKARESDNKERKNYAINALQYLRQRSPGYQYIYQAQHHSQQRQWKAALEFYEMALQLDPELPEAHAGCGNVKQRLGKAEDAARAFEKAYELDPYNAFAISGVAVVRAQAGKIDESLKILERGKERYQHDATFLYNSACVYAQIFEYLGKQKDAPDRETRQEEFRKKAIAELQAATSRGFADYQGMQEDPDLKILKDDADFKKLIGNRPAPQETPEEDDEEPVDAEVNAGDE